ncbi:hypothetical protein ACWIE7_08130 [Dietzia sp. NPDC055343]
MVTAADEQLVPEGGFDSGGFTGYLIVGETESGAGLFGREVMGEDESVDPQGEMVLACQGKVDELFEVASCGGGDLD